MKIILEVNENSEVEQASEVFIAEIKIRQTVNKQTPLTVQSAPGEKEKYSNFMLID